MSTADKSGIEYNTAIVATKDNNNVYNGALGTKDQGETGPNKSQISKLSVNKEIQRGNTLTVVKGAVEMKYVTHI